MKKKNIFIPICSNCLSENKALGFHILVSNAQARCSTSLSRLHTLSHGGMYLDFIKYLTHSFHLTRAWRISNIESLCYNKKAWHSAQT